MTRLSKRQLITYAVVSQNIHGVQDLFTGLLPFFRPILEKKHSELFTPEWFAQEVSESYDWNISVDVVEELIPRLEKTGWLEKFKEHNGHAAYRCRAKPSLDASPDQDIEHDLSALGAELKLFADNISPLIKSRHSEDDLIEIYLTWLLSVEGFNKSPIIQAAEKFLENSVPASESEEGVIEHSLSVDSDDAYICAKFTKHIERTQPGLFQRVVSIASVALLTEVVFDFREPPTRQSPARDLLVFFDGPFVMDALGLSGLDRQQNAEIIITNLKKLECRLAVFEHSCDEIRDNLGAVLKERPALRYGPTGDALRKRELMEDYARSVFADVESYIKDKLAFKIIRQSLD